MSLVCSNFKISDLSLHLAVALLDRYITIKKDVTLKNLQLVGATSILIASKLEEHDTPYITDFVFICADSYKSEDFTKMEQTIMETLNFDMFMDTCRTHLCKFPEVQNEKVKYYLDLVLLNTDILYGFEICDIVESCIELVEKNDNYWSHCIQKIQKFEATYDKHKFKEIHAKYKKNRSLK